MKSLTNTQLNRIKIKDMMAMIQKKIDPNQGLGLYRLKNLSNIERSASAKATDEDLKRIEKLFIKYTLGIEYYPSQKKKVIDDNGSSKIVPIEYEYGSKNT